MIRQTDGGDARAALKIGGVQIHRAVLIGELALSFGLEGVFVSNSRIRTDGGSGGIFKHRSHLRPVRVQRVEVVLDPGVGTIVLAFPTVVEVVEERAVLELVGHRELTVHAQVSAPVVAGAIEIFVHSTQRHGIFAAQPAAFQVAGDMQPVHRRRVVAVDAEAHVVVLAVACGHAKGRTDVGRLRVIGAVTHFHEAADLGPLHVEGIAQQAGDHRRIGRTRHVQVVFADLGRRKGTGLTHALARFDRGVDQKLVGRKQRRGGSQARLHQGVGLFVDPLGGTRLARIGAGIVRIRTGVIRVRTRIVRIGARLVGIRARLIRIRVRLVRIRILLGRKLCHQRLRISIHQQIVFVFAELIGLDAGLRLQPFQRQIRFESVRQFPVRLQKVVERIQGNAGVTVNQRDVEPLVEVEPRAGQRDFAVGMQQNGIRSGRGYDGLVREAVDHVRRHQEIEGRVRGHGQFGQSRLLGHTPIRIFVRTGAHGHFQRAVADNSGGTPKLHLALAVGIHDDAAAVAGGINGGFTLEGNQAPLDVDAGAAPGEQRLFAVGLQGIRLQPGLITQMNGGLVNRRIGTRELDDGVLELHVCGLTIRKDAPRVARRPQGHVDVALEIDCFCRVETKHSGYVADVDGGVAANDEVVAVPLQIQADRAVACLHRDGQGAVDLCGGPPLGLTDIHNAPEVHQELVSGQGHRQRFGRQLVSV